MAFKQAFFILACSSVVFASLSVVCPPRESISCQCRTFSFQGLWVRCRDLISSEKDFQDTLKALKGHKVYILEVYGVNTSMLATDLFQGMHIYAMNLYQVGADDVSLGHSHLVGLENSLKELSIIFDIKSSSIPRWLSTVRLDHLHSLKAVHFSRLNNRELGNGWFKGPNSLEIFSASLGELEKVGDKTFASITNLKSLSLSFNRLNEISRSILPYPANHLESLLLSNNKIRTLPSDIFSGMPELTEVSLENNLIQTLPEDTWSPVFSKLGKKFKSPFKGNPLRCDRDLKWVCDVNIGLFGKSRYDYIKCASPEDKGDLPVKEFCEA